MNTDNGTIGDLAEQVLREVKSDKLTKIAQHEFVKEAAARPDPKTTVGRLLLKVAEELRTTDAPEPVTVNDVKDFLAGVGHAS